MITKMCTKCKTEYPATAEYFYRNISKKGGLCSHCKCCRNAYYRQHYVNTVKGYLSQVYYGVKRRCSDSRRKDYQYYGGRGIRLRFTYKELVAWCVKNKIDPRGLDVDRIDNNGDYVLNNIRFVTHKENCNNKGGYEKLVG